MLDWHLDDNHYFDAEEDAIIEVETEETLDFQYVSNITGDDMDMEVEMTMDMIVSVGLDLWPLIPEKYKPNQILEDYVKETGVQVGVWLTKTRDIVKLLSPNTVSSTTYLRHLGALIGVTFPPEDDTSEDEIRKTLSQAIDWYKVKGTYQAAKIVALIQSFTVNLKDMYTNDYESFKLVDWFVGDEGENPPGLDSSYYKSPHFVVEVLLNKIYTVGSLVYLWKSDYLDNLYSRIEETRPVHTVPHYMVLLNPKTDEFGHVVEVDGEILAKVITANWQFGTKYFDEIGSGKPWHFDDGVNFDSNETSFIHSISKYVLGDGNYPSNIDSSSFDIESPIYTGTIDVDDITIDEEKYTWSFIVPKMAVVLSEISEVGLYIPGAPDELAIGITCPRVEKDSRTELRVVVEVWKKDLSS